MKTLLICASIVVLATVSSCSSGYTCPTYMQDNSQTKTEVLVKTDAQTDSENI